MNDRLTHISLSLLAIGLLVLVIISIVPGDKERTQESNEQMEITAEASTDVGPFSVVLPSGWTHKKLQGIDSLTGQFQSGNVILSYDFGMYADPLPDETDPTYEAVYEPIGSKEAKLVWPKEGQAGIVGVNFPNVGQNKLTIVGAVEGDRRVEVVSIYRTIRFK